MQTRFEAGPNVAMKIPLASWEATVAFYQDVLGFELIHDSDDSATESYRMAFGGVTLWLDRVEGLERPEVWLELETNNLESATRHLAASGTATCDEVEPLPPGLNAHWIRNPAGVVHLVAETQPE